MTDAPAAPTDPARTVAARAAVAIGLLALTLLTAPVFAQSAQAQTTTPLGENFSFAETADPDSSTSAAAYPGVSAFWAGVCDLTDLGPGAASVGTLPVTPFAHCIDHRAQTGPPLAPNVAAVPAPDGSGPDGWTNPPSWRMADVTLGGAHADGSTGFWFSRSNIANTGGLGGGTVTDGAPRNIIVSLPPGVIGNPNAVPKCQTTDLSNVPTTCPPKTQVGVSTVSERGLTYVVPVYNVESRDGNTAEFVVSGLGDAVLNTNAPVTARARTEGDFGVDASAVQLPGAVPLFGQTFTLWAVPWASSHDRYRPIPDYCGNGNGALGMLLTGLAGGFGGDSGGCSQAPQSYDPSWGPIKPFLTTQTECSPQQPVTRIFSDNWHTSVTTSASSTAPLVTDCAALPFNAGFSVQPTSSQADGPTGLSVDLTTPQNNDPPASVRFNPCDAVGPGCSTAGAPAYWKSPAGRATAHLEKTVVTFPEGVAINPAGATGLAGCSDDEIGLTQLGSPPLFDNEDPFDEVGAEGSPTECPDASIIGTAKVDTSLLDEPLTGELVLGNPKSTDPTSGQMFRTFIVVRNRERGLVAKIFGSAVADPATGRVTATFEKNPQVPFDDVEIDVKGGQHGLLALQQRCASRPWSATLTPWSAAHGAGGQPVDSSGAFTTSENCGFGFAPALTAGMDSQQGRGGGTFSFRFSRQDGEQWFDSLTAKLPTGLLASVKDVPLCSNAQANANACPASSRIGIVDAGAGSGAPFFLEKKGTAYLTEGYKGAPYGLAVSVPVEAGPFRGEFALTPIVVRQAIHVDRTTAQVTAISDPFPQIWHGIPVRIREATVKIDRDRFMVNPSDCSPKQVEATLRSIEGTSVTRSVPFQAAGCGSLPFEPKLALRLTGKKQMTTSKHPGVKAIVTQTGVGEAGIEKAQVRLPKSLALDPDNAQALCEFADGTQPDLENRCPKGSIVGRARATSPLLNDPLVGNVYFVKNIRIDPTTGNQIRTLPMLIVALRGEIAVNLRGESDTTKSGKLVNTFDNVPDAPVSQFNLNINGGSKGILAVTRTRRSRINLCTAGRQIAEADMDGHNGKRHDFDVRMTTPCKKKKAKATACKTKQQKRGKACKQRAAAQRKAARGR